MNRQWMYNADRRSREFRDGTKEFLDAAVAFLPPGSFIRCPCVDCKNEKEHSERWMVMRHVITRGFMANYTCWTHHGETEAIRQEDNEEDEEEEDRANSMPDTTQYGSVEDTLDEFGDDELDQMLRDGEGEFTEERQYKKFQSMVEDHRTALYPNCGQGHKKLRTTLELMQWKATNGVSDKGFNGLLSLVKKLLPEGNTLPESTYEAKRVLCPLGLQVRKIHACPNDCILYHNEYADLEACPVCEESRYKVQRDDPDELDGNRTKKSTPAKVLWYFPVIPRLKRLFANEGHAKMMRWHEEERKEDGMLRHPADGSQWRKVDRAYPNFANEVRNIRFGLSTDGMNPFGQLSSIHSTWPVTLCIYNIPPWLCMKRKYIMMPLLIEGPKQPGNDIDVYLKPLVEDLVKLWVDGVRVWDEYKREYFNLRALLFVTINDWPALGNLSGQTVKGFKACTQCIYETDCMYLKNSRKCVYMGHRRFLPGSHALRWKGSKFNGGTEIRVKPQHRNGRLVFAMVKDLKVVFGKGVGSIPVPNVDGHAPTWKKKSIFWDLPYWEVLDVRHSLDFMHITKNVCLNLLGYIDMYGKSKDTLQARKDLEDMEVRSDLHPKNKEGTKQLYLHPASYTPSKEEKKSMIECLNSVKVPSGYSSNVKRLVNTKENKLQGLKSHDCLVLMTQLLPVAIRGILPEWVRGTITKLCSFMNAISQKVIEPAKLPKLEADVVQSLVSLEMIFPPAFFDIMVHLTVHLVKEIGILGPVYLHNMFPFERYMSVLKKYVRNRSRPEGCIAEGYVTEEVIEFCVDYMNYLNPIGVPISRHEGRLRGKGTIGRQAVACNDLVAFKQAHFTVLKQSTIVAPYVLQHKSVLRREFTGKTESWITLKHMDSFGSWLQKYILEEGSNDEILQRLARGPSQEIVTFKGYEINGYTFYTRSQDKRSTNQNSGVRIDAEDNRGRLDTYYGFIEEIWELDYGPLKVPLFKCQWVKLTPNGVKVDKYGMTTVDLTEVGFRREPFVLANDVIQVFYVMDMSSKPKKQKEKHKENRKDKQKVMPKRHVVLQGKRRIVGVENVTDEEEYGQFDELPPFTVDVDINVLRDSDVDAPYIRHDHNEGTIVKTKT